MALNNIIPFPIKEETFEYHHKKFDQNKRLRKNSSGSSSGEYEGIKLEIDSMKEEIYTPTTNEAIQALNSNNSNCFTKETTNKRRLNSETKADIFSDTLIQPAAKKPRTSSFSDSSSTYSSNYSPVPFVQPITTALPSPALTLPPAATVLPKISDDTLRSICKYNPNMVRKFPKKERTPKDQQRRDKNTLACRMSRRVKKLEHIAIEEQYKEFSQQTFDIIEQSMRATAYLHELMQLAARTTANGKGEEQKPNMLMECATPAIAPQQKKPFSIDYLIGSDE